MFNVSSLLMNAISVSLLLSTCEELEYYRYYLAKRQTFSCRLPVKILIKIAYWAFESVTEAWIILTFAANRARWRLLIRWKLSSSNSPVCSIPTTNFYWFRWTLASCLWWIEQICQKRHWNLNWEAVLLSLPYTEAQMSVNLTVMISKRTLSSFLNWFSARREPETF